jgi:predicted dehydrogenase
MTEAIAVAVIGVGAFGEKHVAAYCRQPGVTVVAVADRNSDRAEAVAARWNVPRWFTNGDELIRECRPAGVSIVTPGSQHLVPTLTALDYGCSVLLEKPVAMSSSEAAIMAAKVADSTAFIMPAHILRFSAPYIAAREKLNAGAIGPLLAMSAQRERSRGHATQYSGVHPALMTMIHDIDLALWMTGSTALRVSAHERAASVDESPLLIFATIEAEDGTVWSLRTTWLLPEEGLIPDRLQLHGASGTLVVELQPQVTVLGTSLEHLDLLSASDEDGRAIDSEIGHFCSCVKQGKTSTLVTFTEATHGLRIAEAIISSADADGAWVDVSK